MTWRKISYSKDMVLAKLAGTKHMTRRVIVPQPDEYGLAFDIVRNSWTNTNEIDYSCPYGRPGDGLWIQDGYRVDEFNIYDPGRTIAGKYLADGTAFSVALTRPEWQKFCARKYPFRATPGRFMYRSLSRMADEIVSVKVERVQDISEEDAGDEGYPFGLSQDKDLPSVMLAMTLYPDKWPGIHRAAFAMYWEHLNGKRPGCSWDANPFVWVLETKEVK